MGTAMKFINVMSFLILGRLSNLVLCLLKLNIRKIWKYFPNLLFMMGSLILSKPLLLWHIIRKFIDLLILILFTLRKANGSF